MSSDKSSTSNGANKAGLRFETVDLLITKPDPEVMALAPGEFALKNQVLPMFIRDGVLVVAMSSIESLTYVDDLGVLLQKPVEPVIAEAGQIREKIESFFLERILEGVSGDDAGAEVDDVTDLADLTKMAGDAAVVRMINGIFAQAARDGASDIHIEPYEKEVKIRYRIDGMLSDMMRPPKRMHAALISRLKILSELNIAERRLPQDGRIKLTIAGRQMDVRLSIVPTVYGERAVMRLLDKGTALLGLAELGFQEDVLVKFRKLIGLPHGIILATGPTGSGKSTTLYASLQEIWSPTTNILTIEDPVEYQVPGISQVQVRPNIGLTFASGLRSFLRQDPDIIMVGEMRDLETAEIAIEASLTGHLVLSTLHTVDAAQTIDRIVDVFSPEQQPQIRTQLSVTLQAVISQTLLPTTDGAGRVAAFEVMTATPAIRTLVRDGKTHQLYMDIQTGGDLGMQTLDGCLLDLLKRGQIDFEHAMSKTSNPQDFVRRAQNAGVAGVSEVAANAVH